MRRGLRPSPRRAPRLEVEHHVRELADRLVDEGWDRGEARREAERRFGDPKGVVRTLEALDVERGHGRGGEGMGGLLRDLRLALRAVRQNPAISGAVVASLAVGIGATLTLYPVVDGVLLHPIPVPDPERVVRVFEASGEERPFGGTSYPMLRQYRDASPALEGPAGWTTLDTGFRAGTVTDRVSVGLVTGNWFQVLQVRPAAGRTLTPADDREEAPAVAVLSHGLWQRVWGGDPEVIGRTVELSGTLFEIAGVAPAGFQGASLQSAPDVFVPLTRIRDVAAEGLYAAPNIFETDAFAWISMVGRLRPGASREDVAGDLNRVAARLRDEGGEGEAGGAAAVPGPISVRPLAEGAVVAEREGLVRFIRLLSAVVVMTLMIACLNAALLLSARGWTRRRELGVRQALGADRMRLIRLLLSESVVLALLGGGIGLVTSLAALRVLRSVTLPGGVPMTRLDLALDGRLLAAALLLSVGSAVVFGLLPALAQSGRGLRNGLRTSGRSRGTSALVAGQVSLSLVLLVGSLLFTGTLRSALDTELDFDPEGVAALSMAFRGHGYTGDELPQVLDRIVARVAGAPGVEAASFAAHVPLSPSRMQLRPVPEGWEPGAPGERRPPVGVNAVSPDYFRVLGISLVEGRAFDRRDGAEAEEVAIVNQAAARLLWPEGSPLDRRLVLLRGLDPIAVVGVVEDHKVHSVEDEAEPYLYLPAAQSVGVGLANEAHLLARSQTTPEAAMAVLRQEMRAFDPGLPTWDARLVETQMARVLMPQRLGALLLTLLAAVALVVSGVGVYGMVVFSVRRRWRELGIRMALGAGPGRILAGTVAGSLSAVVVGLLIGTGLTLGLAPFTEAWLLGHPARSPAALAGGALMLGTVAAAAALLPARRAVSIDPRRAMDPDG